MQKTFREGLSHPPFASCHLSLLCLHPASHPIVSLSILLFLVLHLPLSWQSPSLYLSPYWLFHLLPLLHQSFTFFLCLSLSLFLLLSPFLSILPKHSFSPLLTLIFSCWWGLMGRIPSLPLSLSQVQHQVSAPISRCGASGLQKIQGFRLPQIRATPQNIDFGRRNNITYLLWRRGVLKMKALIQSWGVQWDISHAPLIGCGRCEGIIVRSSIQSIVKSKSKYLHSFI